MEGEHASLIAWCLYQKEVIGVILIICLCLETSAKSKSIIIYHVNILVSIAVSVYISSNPKPTYNHIYVDFSILDMLLIQELGL